MTVGIVFGLALCAGLVVYIPIYQEAVDDAQNIDRKLTVRDENPTIIFSAGKKPRILDSVADVRRKVVDLTRPEYPAYIRYAIVAAEDRRFYDHRGVDPVSLGGAVYTALRDRRAGRGGSTISMQLAKLMINGDAHTPLRKLKDIATAQQIENLKTKDEILNLYANYAYYGEHAYGIERAAKIYFNKSATDLTVGEAAMLARSVRLPGRVNPVKSPDKMLGLRDYVLDVMREEGWITQQQYDQGVREVPKLNPNPTYDVIRGPKVARYFTDHVWSQLKRDFPDIDFRAGGYQVETTLNFELQQRATEAVQSALDRYKGQSVNDGAVVVLDQSGGIIAEVGGPDYERRQFNVVTQGNRQPGSSFKAIVYATALKTGRYDLDTMISNAPIHRKDGRGWWNPQNSNRKENARSYSMRTAFAASVNLSAIHTIDDVTPEAVVAAAHDMFGIGAKLMPVPSLALGSSGVSPLEMAEAYSVFMLGGNHVEPRAIARILNPDGTVLRDYTPTPQQTLDPVVAQKMDELLKGPVGRGGTAPQASAIPNARGKTGTTNDHKDAWFVGYSDGIAAAAWSGNTNFKSKKGDALSMGRRVFGGTVAVDIWMQVMKAAHELGIANGVKSVPGTHITVSASPDEPRYTRHTETTDEPVPERTEDVIEPDPGPVEAPAPDPASVEPPPVSDSGDGSERSTPPPIVPAVSTEPTSLPEPERPATTRREPRKETAKRRDPPKRVEPATVDVIVCVDTGQVAGMYCPETVTRTFPKGRAPRKRCTLHHG